MKTNTKILFASCMVAAMLTAVSILSNTTNCIISENIEALSNGGDLINVEVHYYEHDFINPDNYASAYGYQNRVPNPIPPTQEPNTLPDLQAATNYLCDMNSEWTGYVVGKCIEIISIEIKD